LGNVTPTTAPPREAGAKAGVTSYVYGKGSATPRSVGRTTFLPKTL
jgi:hypothetical protein